MSYDSTFFKIFETKIGEYPYLDSYDIPFGWLNNIFKSKWKWHSEFKFFFLIWISDYIISDVVYIMTNEKCFNQILTYRIRILKTFTSIDVIEYEILKL